LLVLSDCICCCISLPFLAMTVIQDHENRNFVTVTSRQALSRNIQPTPMLPICNLRAPVTRQTLLSPSCGALLRPPASPAVRVSSPLSWAALTAQALPSPTPSPAASPRPQAPMLPLPASPLPSRVTFNEAVSVSEITPAILTYGDNPAFFNFDGHGNKIYYHDAEGNTIRAPYKDLTLASPDISPSPIHLISFGTTPHTNPLPVFPTSPAAQSPAQQSAPAFCAADGQAANVARLPTDSSTRSSSSLESHPAVWKSATPSNTPLKAALHQADTSHLDPHATFIQTDKPHLDPFATFRIPASPVSFGIPVSPACLRSPVLQPRSI